MDLYEFFLSSYKQTPKEKLLEFMASHPEIEQLRSMTQEELAKTYCYRMVSAVSQQSKWKAETPSGRSGSGALRVIRHDAFHVRNSCQKAKMHAPHPLNAPTAEHCGRLCLS